MKKARGIMGMWLKRLIKPLMNERGAVGDAGDPPAADAVTFDENGFIAGTNYKSVPEMIKAHGELKSKLDAQGNEIGTLRKAVDSLSAKKETPAAAPTKTDAPDYDAEIASVNEQIAKLDTMDDKFGEKQAKLISTLTNLTAKAIHERTLNAAGELMKKELSTRDQKAALDKFHADNPDFKTPETQAEIDEFLANDRSGMHDKFSAYFKIQADKAMAAVAEQTTKNAEMQRALDLANGKAETGKVIVKGQSPQNVTKQPTNLTGKERDAAMLEALKATRGT